MRNLKLLPAAAVLALAGACATPAMTKKECLAGDWRGAGLEDGLAGLLESNFDARAAACYEHDAGADLAAYQAGREEGLTRLCNEPGGHAFGLQGRDYLGVCAPDAEEGFLSGYLVGRRIYVAQQARNAAQKAYDDAVAALDYHHDQLRRGRARLADPDASEKDLKKARNDVDYHRNEIANAQSDIDRRLYELGRADEAYDAIVGTSRDWRQGEAFASARALLLDVQDFARREPAVRFCTDELPDYRPRCELREGALLKDETGAVCAAGPGALRFRGQKLAGRNEAPEDAILWAFYPIDERGRIARAPAGEVRTIFGREGYRGARCSARTP